MGRVKEPEVDLYVINKPWTEEEKKEFSEFLKKYKEQRRRRSLRNSSKRTKKVSYKISGE